MVCLVSVVVCTQNQLNKNSIITITVISGGSWCTVHRASVAAV